MGDFPMPPEWVAPALRDGLVIPAHPLALTSARKLDERRQRALTRYYHAAGAGGIAVGVHTTQFAIRDPKHGLLDPVLRLAAETITDCDARAGTRTVRIAGLCGPTPQAVAEAAAARALGYHAGLLSLAGWNDADDDRLIDHCLTVAREVPVIGFYLQPAVGGRILTQSFWRRFAEVPNLLAIKIAPFNRYHSLDVVRAVIAAGRTAEIALYTGNDDTIITDLITDFQLDGARQVFIVGGLLGHWAFWTRRAVDLLAEIKRLRVADHVPSHLLTLAAQMTDCNAAVFDAAHGFAGCLPGIHEILRRQGLLEGTWCLDSSEALSPGQAAEIDRVCHHYPHLADDAFVRQHLDQWLHD